MARASKKKDKVGRLFAVALTTGLLQMLILYQSTYSTADDQPTLSPLESVTRAAVWTITAHPTYPKVVRILRDGSHQTVINIPERRKVIHRRLPANRPNARRVVHTPKVTLNFSLLNVTGESFYRQVGMDLPLRRTPGKFLKPSHNPMLHGIERPYTGYLTIGISSVKRPNTDRLYIYDTLDSLLQNIEDFEKPNVTMVVLLSDPDSVYNNDIAHKLYTRYTQSIDLGIIRIIEAPKEMYPNFDKVKQTFNDPILRIKWRAKQNIDFAYLSAYCVNISKYYIQIEDDVISSKNLISDIRNFTSSQGRKWFLLEFSNLGYIGKLFHSRNLPWVANFLLTFFDKMPCDLLLGRMREALGNLKPVHSPKSLFQHVGKFSSLKNKLMPSLDDQFKDAGNVTLSAYELPPGRNPPASIVTNMKAFNNSQTMDAYNNNVETFFWVLTPTPNSYITLTLEKKFNFSRIIVITGDSKTKHDSLKSGALLYSTGRYNNITGNTTCSTFEALVNFVGGEVDTKAMGIRVPLNIQCLKIFVKRRSKTWVKFRNIILL